MIRVPRWLVAILASMFALFQAWLGLTSFEVYSDESVEIVALSFYLIAILSTILFYRDIKMPLLHALLNLIAAAWVPLLINSVLNSDYVNDYSTWYVSGIGLLMGITAVRQHKTIAWVGFAIMAIEIISWAGPDAIFKSGLPGSFLLVFAGHTISTGISSASKAVIAYTQQLLEIETEQVATSAARTERQLLVEKTLRGALPILTMIRDKNGALTDEQKIDARLLEASLRDEIRGRGLMNTAIRTATESARRRGVEVIILDEGGLDQHPETQRDLILTKAAAAIDSVVEGRVTLRSPAGEAWSVTLAATRPGVASPDLWLKF